MPIPLATNSLQRSPTRMKPALFNVGFRPFYLAAAAFACLGLPISIAQFFGVLPMPELLSGAAWHAHEMVFGFAAAVIVGFLFTAVRAWTGLPTPSGAALGALAALWGAGRLAMLVGPAAVAACIDALLLPIVAWCLWRPLDRSGNRNRFFVLILLALALLNFMFHLARLGVTGHAPLVFVEAALGVVVMIVAIMAGRVVPTFTRNAVRTAQVRQFPGLDGAALASLAAAWTAWILDAPGLLAGSIALAAGLLHAVRLWTWDPWCTRRQPILWILHVSYAWIPLGCLLLGLALTGAWGTPATALHAFAAGAVGGMIIGMITRTARGHTGMRLETRPVEVLAYVLVHLGAVLRVFVPLAWPAGHAAAWVAAAACWSAAFGLYCVVYWPLLSRARVDGKPG